MLLLDTCAAIWLANGDAMSAPSRSAIRAAAGKGEVLVSPVSAWEIGMLAARPGSSVSFTPGPEAWFDSLLTLSGIRLLALTPRAAMAASFLPGRVHGDPADRLLIAAAREVGASLVTRDAKILAYAKQGHVKAVRC
jgi:PIN domain nuclease of toxin-antitoxin system